MLMQDLIDFLQINSALVLANPIAFSTFAVLFAGGGFLVGRYFLAERVANLESRIARRDDEIKALKEGRSSAEESKLPMVPIIATKAIWGEEEIASLTGSLFTHTEDKIRLSQS
ncbi:hypothetical protein [Mesorhizobium sp.]|uniref:hypothetical protein n=2 Tax=Mesorhizobium sp. TaxID=1871066 RepID=UPI0025794C4D|nr:hypothetical protein [Mesorhizobium sp.]